MATPKFVPTDPTQPVRRYHSPPRRPDPWMAERPADLRGGQPTGGMLGNLGPDQGYALKLVHHLEDELHLGGVDRDDAVAGCLAVAMKRSALFGRGPIIHDLRAAFTVFGFLDPSPPAELVELRRRLFAEVHSDHHYAERRHIADLVPAEVLRQPHDAIAAAYDQGWRSNLAL